MAKKTKTNLQRISKISTFAKSRLRDSKGHFIKASQEQFIKKIAAPSGNITTEEVQEYMKRNLKEIERFLKSEIIEGEKKGDAAMTREIESFLNRGLKVTYIDENSVKHTGAAALKAITERIQKDKADTDVYYIVFTPKFLNIYDMIIDEKDTTVHGKQYKSKFLQERNDILPSVNSKK